MKLLAHFSGPEHIAQCEARHAAEFRKCVTEKQRDLFEAVHENTEKGASLRSLRFSIFTAFTSTPIYAFCQVFWNRSLPEFVRGKP